MRLLFAALLTIPMLACQPQQKTLRVIVLAKTQDMIPVAGAEVTLNNRVIGLTDNFGALTTTESFEVNRKEFNIIRVSKFSDINKFDDAIIALTENALNSPTKTLNIRAKMTLHSGQVTPIAVAATQATQNEDSDVSDIELQHAPAVAAVKASPVPAPKTAPKVAAVAPAKPKKEEVKTLTPPAAGKSLAEVQYNRSRKNIENGNPQQALADIQKVTLAANGTRNYALGELYSAHINEGIAHFMLADKYLQRNEPKQAVASLEKSVAVFNLCLNNIDKAPLKNRENIIIEARFNRALALQKLYVDMKLANYKIETYKAWRGVYMSLSRQGTLGGRRASIQKYAIQSMQKLGQELL